MIFRKLVNLYLVTEMGFLNTMKVYGYFIRIILLSSLFCSFFVTPVYGESRSEAVYTEFSDQDLVSLLENHNKKNPLRKRVLRKCVFCQKVRFL